MEQLDKTTRRAQLGQIAAALTTIGTSSLIVLTCLGLLLVCLACLYLILAY